MDKGSQYCIVKTKKDDSANALVLKISLHQTLVDITYTHVHAV